MLISVNQPVTVLIFFGELMKLVNFQLIELGEFYNKVFNLDPDSTGNSPYNSQFELMGYSSLYIVQNFGMLCISLFAPFVAGIIALMTAFLGKFGMIKFDYSKITKKARNWLLFGFWISFFDETYLFLFVCSGLNFRNHFEWQ